MNGLAAQGNFSCFWSVMDPFSFLQAERFGFERKKKQENWIRAGLGAVSF